LRPPRQRHIAAAVVLAAGLFLPTLYVAREAASWLVRPVPNETCDLMVVLGGGARERILSASDLHRDGACRKVMVTGVLHESEIEGLPSDEEVLWRGSLLPAPWISGSTFEDAAVALHAAREHGATSVLVVTSPYHLRRTAWVFSRVFAGSGIRFGLYPSESFYMDYAHWWSSRDGRDVVLGEYGKLWLYALGWEMVLLVAAGSC